ncbi:MAG: TonB-dependent receptor plug domain-containing protein [Fibrobacteria bacterium]
MGLRASLLGGLISLISLWSLGALPASGNEMPDAGGASTGEQDSAAVILSAPALDSDFGSPSASIPARIGSGSDSDTAVAAAIPPVLPGALPAVAEPPMTHDASGLGSVQDTLAPTAEAPAGTDSGAEESASSPASLDSSREATRSAVRRALAARQPDTAALELPTRRVAAHRRSEGPIGVKSDFIRKMPSAMNDPVRAVAFTPGVTVQNDVNVRPFVRGGDAEQTRVVLDGMPLLQPYHVGGVFSMFNLNTLDGVELYRDDFPVEDPGALSGVLRLKTKTRLPETPHVNANLSLVRGDAYAEVPLIPGSLSIYGAAQLFLFNRALHGILDVSSAVSQDSAFQADMQGYRDHINMPDFLDYHWGAAWAPSPGLRLDYMTTLSTDAYAVVVPRQTNVLSRINPKFGDPTRAVSPPTGTPTAYKRAPQSKKLSVDSISAVSIGNQMHFLNLAWDANDEHLIENGIGFQTQDWDVEFKHGAGTASNLALSQSARYANYRFSDTWTASESNRFRFGVSYDYKFQRYHMNLPYVLYDVIVNGNVDMLEPLGYFSDNGFDIAKDDSARTNFDYLGEYPSRISFVHQGALEEHFASAFFSHRWKAGNGALTYGLRADYQSTSGELFPSPRLDYHWDVDDRNALSFTSGLYAQNNLPFYERDRNQGLLSEKSGQLGLQWTHRFSKGYRASIDGYYKRYYDLVTASLAPDYSIDLKGFLLPLPGSSLSRAQVAELAATLDTVKDFSSLSDSVRNAAYEAFGGLIFQYANGGTGNSYGTELSFFYEPTNVWNGWISADFSLSDRSDGEGRPYYPYRYHRPVVVNWVNWFDIPGGFDIGFTFRWAMGQPYTPYTGNMDGLGSVSPLEVGARNSGRLSPYSRLDIRLTRSARLWNRDFKAYMEVWNSMNSPNYFARDNSTGQLKSASLNWPFPLFFLGVSGDL